RRSAAHARADASRPGWGRSRAPGPWGELTSPFTFHRRAAPGRPHRPAPLGRNAGRSAYRSRRPVPMGRTPHRQPALLLVAGRHELDRWDRGVAVLTDRRHADAADERGQSQRVLPRLGEDDLEAEVAEGFHGGGDELARPLRERLVDDDRRVPGDLLPRARQLVAQGRGEAEGGEPLVLTAGERAAGLVGV